MIRFSGAGERDLRRLEGAVRRRIAAALAGVEPDPGRGPNVRKLEGAGGDIYRLRVGDDRNVYEIFGGDALVSTVAHRRDVYRKARRRGR